MPRKRKKLKRLSESDIIAIEHIARSSLGIAGIVTGDLPDVKQELALHLCLKYHMYKSRQSAWSTFRGVILEQGLRQIIRKRRKKSEIPLSKTHSVSLDIDVPRNIGDGDITWKDCVTEDRLIADGTEKPEISGLDLKVDMAIFMESLSPQLREVCIVLQYGSIQDVVMQLNIPLRSVYRRIDKIRKLMIAAGLNAYL